MKNVFFFLLIASLSAIALGGDYVVIVNKDSPLADISKAELKRVYTGKVNDIGGNKVSVANLALDNPAAQSFLTEITGMGSDDYKSFWLAQQIRGGSTAPAVKKTPEAMIEFIKGSSETVGYLPKDASTEGVKVLTVK